MRTRTLSGLISPMAAVIAVGLCLGLFSSPVWGALEDLRVNEIMAANRVTLLDEAGDADDWVEIFNTGATPVNVEGMFLSDDPADTQKWSFPDTIITPGGYLIVWCDNEPEEGPLHTSFNLNADGEFVGLYEYLAIGNDVVDSTSFGHQATDVSYGRYPNGTGPFGFMPTPTPSAENAPFGNIPPFFEDTRHVPPVPADGEPVTVVTTISDDSQILEAKVFYDPGTGFEQTWLYDDGAHGDGDPDNAPSEAYSYFVGYEPPALYVNEFMAANNTTIPDDYGEYDDWAEIYNRSDVDVNVGGMHLTDDPGDPNQFELPDTVIPARGFLLIWCDDDTEQGPLHANFRLSASGEFIGLYDREDHSLVALDTLTFGPQTADVSYGRLPNGGPDWVFFDAPTPGDPNGSSAVVARGYG
jgi:hypothetical protein